MAKESTDITALEPSGDASHALMEVDESLTKPQNGDVLPAKRSSKFCSSKRLTLALILLLSIACLIIGIALITLSKAKCDNDTLQSDDRGRQLCTPSEEGKRVQLKSFFEKVAGIYRTFHPSVIAFQVRDPEIIRREFQADIPTPRRLKEKTDAALELLRELDAKDVNRSKLNLLERKDLSKVRFFLKSVFGKPYQGNYYNGDWMLGPNFFCWQPICFFRDEISTQLHFLKPQNVAQLERLRGALQSYNEAILQYMENVKVGVKTGMVGSVEECRAGLDALKSYYRDVYKHGAQGILEAPFVSKVLQPDFLKDLAKTQESLDKVRDSLEKMLVDHLGLPLKQLFNYLEGEHLQHCVPSNVSSGLASRPLAFVYVGGVANKSNPTLRRLPTGESIVGASTYAKILSFFTTTDITPEEVYSEGERMVKQFYSQILELAKEVTGKNDTKQAVKEFKRNLTSQDMYFNGAPIPAHESGPEAHELCSNETSAKRFCPERWKALQKWFRASREAMGMLDPHTQKMFYFTGPKRSTPSCPVAMVPDFNPSSSAQTYRSSDQSCSNNCAYSVPFFVDNLGPVYTEWSVNAHEARPGHHTQVQGFVELFANSCAGLPSLINQLIPFVGFEEGWGLYAESLILEDTNVYQDNLLNKYGALKWQLWRALRLLVDSGLHYKNMTRSQALQLFADYAWDTSDVARKEVTRYQSGPGQATAYMIGQLAIRGLRQNAEKKLNTSFNLKEFHYQVLSQGTAPLSFLTSIIDEYIECKLEDRRPGCRVILSPLIETEAKASSGVVKSPLPIYRRRYYL